MKSKRKVNLKYLKQCLLERRNNILEQLRQSKEAKLFDASNIPADDVEMAEGRFDRDIFAKISDNWSAELAEIDIALINIEKDEYGVCLDCGSAISTPRLLAIPSASLCIHCQEQHEESEKERAPRYSEPWSGNIENNEMSAPLEWQF